MARRQPEHVANPARGIALVVAAVLIGLLLLRNGLDSSANLSAGTDTSTDGGTPTDAGSDSADESTTTTLADRAPAEVKVIVLNGSGVSGAAKRFSEALGAVGYDLTDADGDNSSVKPDTTQVLYTEGYQADAAAVATAIVAPQANVLPLGTQTPGNLAGANVIVILAVDRANDETPATP